MREQKESKIPRKNIPTIVIMLTVGIALFSLSTALAVNGPGPAKAYTDKTSAHVAMLKERLKLTDIQAEKIKAILEESHKQVMTDKVMNMSDPAAVAKWRAEQRQATDEKIKALLTDEQKKEFDKMNAERHQAMKEHQGHPTTEKMAPGMGHEPGAGSGGTGKYPGGK
jgi:Spy/CpxP family protein refolding chaperone